MKYLSLCSGIEAATVAWHPLGWEAVAYSEIERFPSEVLAHHYPNTPNLGDMTKFKEWTNVSNVDLLVGGTPCQSFSVAGLRKGLDDPRGNLMLTYLAIADKFKPKWIVWENVPGVLSSNGGKDFGVFLGALGELGYGFAYRVLDAQYFGVAQRRKRVFVVGYLGDWRAAAAVLFERHSLQGHPAPSREKRQAVAASIRAGASSSSAITARMVAFGEYSDDGTASAMKARDYKDATDLVAIGAFGKDVSDTVTSKFSKGAELLQQGAQNGGNCVLQPIVLDRAAFNQGENAQYKFRAEHSETMDSLVARGPHAVLQPIPIHDQATRHAGKNGEKTMGKGNGLGVGHPGEPMNTLTKGDRHAVAFGFDAYNHTVQGQVNQPLRVSSAPGQVDAVGGVVQGMAVRRLTPVECERLQGFPDNYTDIKSKNKPTPDGPRYKALGNSMAVPVMAWIGQRIEQVEAICKQNK
jgi:DNA (cytosine-5)-methyltransferase 1